MTPYWGWRSGYNGSLDACQISCSIDLNWYNGLCFTSFSSKQLPRGPKCVSYCQNTILLDCCLSSFGERRTDQFDWGFGLKYLELIAEWPPKWLFGYKCVLGITQDSFQSESLGLNGIFLEVIPHQESNPGSMGGKTDYVFFKPANVFQFSFQNLSNHSIKRDD